MSHSDLLVSFFSLVKNNNGFFKSEKQAAFMLSRTENGVYITRQTMTFGEYEARTQRNSASVEWCVTLDNQGITKMVKRTSKGESVHFERNQEFFDKIAAKKAAHVAAVEADKAYSARLIAEYNQQALSEAKGELAKVEAAKEVLFAMPNHQGGEFNNMYDYLFDKYSNRVKEFEAKIV